MKESIKVYAPATVANVGCGFDILGFAVNNPGDEVTLRKTNSGKVVIREITGDQGKLSYDPDQNTVGVAVQKFLAHIHSDQGIDISLHKKMPLGSGLGSSSASSCAGVFAINQLMGEPYSKEQLIPFAMEGERIACGSAHADNVAPCILGGFVLIRSYDPLDIHKIPTPVEMYATVVHPQIEIRTKEARELLKKQIYLKDAVVQWGNVAGLILGLMQPDYQLISNSLQDVIVEPIRSILIPGYDQCKKASLQSGALGFGISGSGPSLFALSQTEDIAKIVGERISQTFSGLQIENSVYISKINQQGPVVL